jgi:hypothetical protein
MLGVEQYILVSFYVIKRVLCYIRGCNKSVDFFSSALLSLLNKFNEAFEQDVAKGKITT